MNNLEEMI